MNKTLVLLVPCLLIIYLTGICLSIPARQSWQQKWPEHLDKHNSRDKGGLRDWDDEAWDFHRERESERRRPNYSSGGDRDSRLKPHYSREHHHRPGGGEDERPWDSPQSSSWVSGPSGGDPEGRPWDSPSDGPSGGGSPSPPKGQENTNDFNQVDNPIAPMMGSMRRIYHVYEDNVRGFAKRFRNMVYVPFKMMG